jgi:3'(2'), 5'-bisphosphate nucleotidase
MRYERELQIAKELAIEAGKVIMEVYTDESYKVMIKSDTSPVTTADHLANEMIVSKLEELFPQYAILSEESVDDFKRRENDYCWLIDPLDGTKEFIKRNGEFSVNIALIYKKRPVLGVIYVPITSELFSAVEGDGSYYESPLGEIEKIHVSDRLEKLVAVRSRSRISHHLLDHYNQKDSISTVIKLGSSLKGCYIAKGDADIYYSMGHTMEWDTAAMEVIVSEAGGIFRQLDDSTMQYNRKDVLNRRGFYILNNIINKLDIERERK